MALSPTGLALLQLRVGGSIYDLAAAVEGGPTGSGMRGEDFKQAKARVIEVYGDR